MNELLVLMDEVVVLEVIEFVVIVVKEIFVVDGL